MDNATLINTLVARWFPKKPRKRYTAEVDVSDMVRGKTSGAYKESQKNKPSPSSQFTYNTLLRIFSWSKLKKNHITRSYTGWTNSMEPTFDYGDLIFKTPYERYKKLKGELRLGQIAIYTYGDMRIIHRYIGKTSDGKFVFKGDNNFRADPPVKEENIVDVQVGVFHTWDKVTEGQD